MTIRYVDTAQDKNYHNIVNSMVHIYTQRYRVKCFHISVEQRGESRCPKFSPDTNRSKFLAFRAETRQDEIVARRLCSCRAARPQPRHVIVRPPCPVRLLFPPSFSDKKVAGNRTARGGDDTRNGKRNGVINKTETQRYIKVRVLSARIRPFSAAIYPTIKEARRWNKGTESGEEVASGGNKKPIVRQGTRVFHREFPTVSTSRSRDGTMGQKTAEREEIGGI